MGKTYIFFAIAITTFSPTLHADIGDRIEEVDRLGKNIRLWDIDGDGRYDVINYFNQEGKIIEKN